MLTATLGFASNQNCELVKSSAEKGDDKTIIGVYESNKRYSVTYNIGHNIIVKAVDEGTRDVFNNPYLLYAVEWLLEKYNAELEFKRALEMPLVSDEAIQDVSDMYVIFGAICAIIRCEQAGSQPAIYGIQYYIKESLLSMCIYEGKDPCPKKPIITVLKAKKLNPIYAFTLYERLLIHHISDS